MKLFKIPVKIKSKYINVKKSVIRAKYRLNSGQPKQL